MQIEWRGRQWPSARLAKELGICVSSLELRYVRGARGEELRNPARSGHAKFYRPRRQTDQERWAKWVS